MFPTCVVSCTLPGRTVKQRDLWRQRPTYSCAHSAPTRADRQHVVMLVAMSSQSGLCETTPPSQQDEVSVAAEGRSQWTLHSLHGMQVGRTANRTKLVWQQRTGLSGPSTPCAQDLYIQVHVLNHGPVHIGPHPAHGPVYVGPHPTRPAGREDKQHSPGDTESVLLCFYTVLSICRCLILMAYCTCCNLCFITVIVLSKEVNSKVLVTKGRININEDRLSHPSETFFLEYPVMETDGSALSFMPRLTLTCGE